MRPLLVVLVLVGSLRVARAEDDDALYKCREVPPTTKIAVTFAPETSLKDLATWVLGFSCKNIVFAADVPKYATKVTVIAPNKMTPKQALALFVDAVQSTGLVVQVKPDTIIIKLGPNMPKGCPDVAASSSPSAGELGKNPFPKVEEPVAVDDLDVSLGTIRKIDDTHVEVPAAVVDKILADPMTAGKGQRVVPAMKDGKPIGFKIYAVRPTGFLGRLGFLNGDTIHSINGYDLTSADKALEAYTKVRESAQLDIAITRRGKPLTLTIKIKR